MLAAGGINGQRVMSYRGTIKNGVVVLEAGADLPEGAAVRVEPEGVNAMPEALAVTPDADLDAAWRIGELAKPTGIPDLSVNIDHYLYGHPKVSHAS